MQGKIKVITNNKVGGDEMKKYPFVKQEESKDCGAACLSMIIQYYNGYLNMENIRNLINITKDGTTAYNLIEGAKEIGFRASGFKCELEQLKQEKIVYPLIANVIINKSYTHFVVIYEINYKKEEIVIADPADKIKKISFESFKSIYNGIILTMYPEAKIPFEQKSKISILDFLTLFKNQKKLIVNIAFLSLFVIVYSVILSYSSQFLLDGLNISKNYLLMLFIIFIIINVIKNVSEYFRDIVFTYITKKIELILTTDSFKKILLLPYSYYRNHNSGDILTRLKDVSIIRDTLSRWLMIIVVDVPLMIVSSILLYIINTKLTSITLLMFVLYWIVLKSFHTPLDTTIDSCHNENSVLTSKQIEAINAFETLKGINIENKVIKKIENQESSFLNSLHKFQKLSLLENFLKELIHAVGYLVIFYLGCCLVKEEQMTLGLLLTYSNLMNYFLNPIRDLVDLDADTKNMKKAIVRLKELFVQNKEIGYIKKKMYGDIEFKNLSYTYNRTNKVLKNINLKIKKGEKVLITGKSGCGKSTLLKLLKKYYPVERGKIIIGKYDINDYCKSDSISYINQSEFLFTDSLYNNIVLERNINVDKLNEIFNVCEIEDIIKNSNLGYFKLIEENGFNLSGGERQRIVLARTIVKPFEILIVDEGLSQVDVDMERRILKKLFSKYDNKTIIVISHRLDNLDLYDHHVCIMNGYIEKDLVRLG